MLEDDQINMAWLKTAGSQHARIQVRTLRKTVQWFGSLGRPCEVTDTSNAAFHSKQLHLLSCTCLQMPRCCKAQV